MIIFRENYKQITSQTLTYYRNGCRQLLPQFRTVQLAFNSIIALFASIYLVMESLTILILYSIFTLHVVLLFKAQKLVETWNGHENQSSEDLPSWYGPRYVSDLTDDLVHAKEAEGETASKALTIKYIRFSRELSLTSHLLKITPVAILRFLLFWNGNELKGVIWMTQEVIWIFQMSKTQVRVLDLIIIECRNPYLPTWICDFFTG